MDPLELLHVHRQWRVRNLDLLYPTRLYRIVRRDRICIAWTAWILIHIWEDPTNIRSYTYEYIYFPSNDIFIMNSEFVINQQLMCANLVSGWNMYYLWDVWCLSVCRI